MNIMMTKTSDQDPGIKASWQKSQDQSLLTKIPGSKPLSKIPGLKPLSKIPGSKPLSKIEGSKPLDKDPKINLDKNCSGPRQAADLQLTKRLTLTHLLWGWESRSSSASPSSSLSLPSSLLPFSSSTSSVGVEVFFRRYSSHSTGLRKSGTI